MSLFAKFRAKWHPGSYLWIVPGFITILASRVNSPQSENLAVRAFTVFVIVHCLNFIVWVHSRNSRLTILTAYLNAVLMIVANQVQVVIAITTLIFLTFSYLLKSNRLNTGTILMISVLGALNWETPFRHVVPLIFAYLVMEYIFPIYRNSVSSSLISMYFLVASTFLFIFGILWRDISVAMASLLLLPTFMAIRK